MSKQVDDLAIWRRMTPADRDYDRFVARRVPAGATFEAETEGGKRLRDGMLDKSDEARGCSCHYSAPCSFCMSMTEEEADIAWGQGVDAMLKFRHSREAEGQVTE